MHRDHLRPSRWLHRRRQIDARDETFLSDLGREIVEAHKRAVMTGDAEVARQRLEQLHLGGHHGRFRRSLFANTERVSLSMTRVSAHMAALNLALADLRAAPLGCLRLSGSQNQLGGGRGDQCGGLVGAVDSS